MPTALDYRAAADRFRRLATRLADDRNRARHEAIAGGPVADALSSSLVTVDIRLRDVTDELLRLAEVCERRADVCADYALALRRYHSLDDAARWFVRAPSPPANWVEP